MIDAALTEIREGNDLSTEQMQEAIGLIMDGRVAEEQIAEFLKTLHKKGESVTEIAGAAGALRERMTRLPSKNQATMDIVGTGGDGCRTFNISTCTALVVASAGVTVAKHGNRAVTSSSGSSDVLRTLGVNVEAPIEVAARCLDETGFCFCFAPLYHSAMKVVAPVRAALGIPTIFNMLGPLINPASTPKMLLGVGRRDQLPRLAEAIRLLGTERTMLVHGAGTDEISLSAPTDFIDVEGDISTIGSIIPEDLGLKPVMMHELMADGPEHSASIIRGVLDGHDGPARRIVLASAGVALWMNRFDNSVRKCVDIAAEAIDLGKTKTLLEQLVEISCDV